MTIVKTCERFIDEVETIIVENIERLLLDHWTARKQRGVGSHHSIQNLLADFSGWNSVMCDEIEKLDNKGS